MSCLQSAGMWATFIPAIFCSSNPRYLVQGIQSQVASSEAPQSFLHTAPRKSYKAHHRPFSWSTWKHTEHGPVGGWLRRRKGRLPSVFSKRSSPFSHLCCHMTCTVMGGSVGRAIGSSGGAYTKEVPHRRWAPRNISFLFLFSSLGFWPP